MTSELDMCDVLVIGGAAGSTAAALLAEKGWNVELWEKDGHPKFHIGESLLPHTLPILKNLGVLDEVEKIGLRKYGAELLSPYHQKRVTLYFGGALDKFHPYAYQVRRAEFDEILFKNCQKKGAIVRDGMEVKEVRFADKGPVLIIAGNSNGQTMTQKARFVVDASGRRLFWELN